MTHSSLMVNTDRTVMVRFWSDGTTEVCTRPNPGATWGPPVAVMPEARDGEIPADVRSRASLRAEIDRLRQVIADELECPDCEGHGTVDVQANPRDPAAVESVRCATCGGTGDRRKRGEAA
ncbi:MAG TPA: hypothetical protein VFJ21_13895 [Mycobacteriales bacterium]|nr:hypothetical protein [Mycobacteriales bacterium]